MTKKIHVAARAGGMIFAVAAACLPAQSYADVCAINPVGPSSSNNNQLVGYDSGDVYVAQSFTAIETGYVSAIGVGFYNTAGVVDTLTPELWSFSSTPGSSLETGSGISPVTPFTNAYATSTFSGTTLITSGDQYAVVWARSGALDSTSYWNSINKGSFTYLGGSGFTGDSTPTWFAESAPFDQNFEVDCVPVIPPAPTSTAATSSLDQSEQNLGWGFMIFLAGFWTVYLVTSSRRNKI